MILIRLTILFMLLTKCLTDVRIDLNELSCQGSWSIQQNKLQTKQSNQQQKPSAKQKNVSPFSLLSTTSGLLSCYFHDSNLRDAFQNKQKVDEVALRLYDPKFIDEKILILKMKLDGYIESSDQWQSVEKQANYTFFNQLELENYGNLTVNYTVGKQSMNIKTLYYDINLTYGKKQYPIILPVSMLFLNLLVYYLVLRMPQIASERISIISLYHYIFFLLYLSTFLILSGLSSMPSTLGLLLPSGLLQILIIFKLIRKFQALIQRLANLYGYCVFYCVLFGYIWAVFGYINQQWFIILNSLGLAGQIVHSARWGNKLGYNWQYLAVLSSNQIYFLYIKGYSNNVLRYKPQYWLCAIIIIIIAIQIAFIMLQNKKGVLFFVPKYFLPNYFQFYRTFVLSSNSQLYTEQCAICLCALTDGQICPEEQLAQKSSKSLTTKKSVILMITPCHHKFHSLCLQQWMDIKRECPVDRSQLPILYK